MLETSAPVGADRKENLLLAYVNLEELVPLNVRNMKLHIHRNKQHIEILGC